MKVCHVTSVHNAFDSRIFEKECHALADAGYFVYLVQPGDSCEKDGISIIGGGEKPQNRWKRFFTYRKKIYTIAKELDCDVYHFHDPEMIPFALKFKKRGKKVIYDSHEDTPRQISDKKWIPRLFRNSVAKIYEHYEKGSLAKCDLVVCATQGIGDIFDKHEIKSVVVHNYPIRRENSGKDRKQGICFAGSLSRTNGLFQLIDACVGIQIDLYLAGPLHEDVREYITSKHSEYIHYLGIISQEEVYELYSQYSIGVVADLPTGNNIDGLPIKMFEFMNAGMSVITSDFPIRREIWKKYQFGLLVDPNRQDELNKAITLLMNNEEERRKYAQFGRRAIENEYNWDIEKSKLIKSYQEVINE